MRGVWFFLAFCLVLALPMSSHAARFLQLTNFVHPAHAVAEDELWIAADQILIDGRVEQSFFAVANHATLAGQFDQDVWLAARHIGGHPFVRQSMRLAARRQIQFNGNAEGNLMALSGDSIQVGPQARVGRNALLIAPSVVIEGEMDGDVRVWAIDTIVSGRIGGTLDARTANLQLMPGAQIDGDVRHSASQDPVFDSRVRIRGTLMRAEDEKPLAVQRGWAQIGWLGQVYLYGAAIFTGIMFMILLPEYAGRCVRLARRSFWKSLIAGAIWFVLIPLGIMVVGITIVGLPLAILAGLMYGILIYASKIVVAMAFGAMLLRRRGTQSFGPACGTLLVGMLFLYLGANLPIVGVWIAWVILLAGLGALLLGMRPMTVSAAEPPTLPISETINELTKQPVTQEINHASNR